MSILKRIKRLITHQSELHKHEAVAIKMILSQRDNFLSAGIHEYKFLANDGSCSDCSKLNNKRFRISKMAIGVNAPPLHKGCRCFIVPFVDRKKWDEDLKKRGL